MEALADSLLPKLTVLVGSRCAGCSTVSDGQCKSSFTHVTISLQLQEEVMSSGQLALICAAALCVKKKKYRAEVEPKLRFGSVAHQCVLALCLERRHTARAAAESH